MAGSGSIWIVEDDENLQALLQATLQVEGYTLKSFKSGAESLKQLKEADESPDLILLDIMLPGVGGLEVLRRLREQYTSLELPVIILSAKHDKGTIIQGLELGANDYLTKPYDRRELLARINTHMGIASLTKQNQQTLVKLKEMDQLKDEALTVVSHDLKGPISTLMAGIDMLQGDIKVESEDKEHYQKILQSMSMAVKMMDPLIKKFLDLQAIKSRQLQLQETKVNLNSIVQNVADQYRNLSQRKGIKVVLKLDDKLPDSMGDPLRLKQIVGNLVNNAIKYSASGSNVEVRTKHQGSTIRVEVKDNGAGIAPEDVFLLFKEFTPLSDKTTNGNGKPKGTSGTGVGLYIAQRLVEMHQGKLQVDTELGKGSTFWFEIPVVQGVSPK